MVTRTEGLLYDIGQGYSSLDAQAARDRMDGYAVVSGLAVTTDGTNLTLDVASGTALVGFSGESSDTVSVSAGTVTLNAADASDPRKDTIYVDTAGVLQVEQGTPQTAVPSGNTQFNTYVPEPPEPSTEGVILAEVWVAAGATVINTADIRDRRQPAEASFGSAYGQSLLTDEVVNKDYNESVTTLASASGTTTIDLSTANYQEVEAVGNVTVAFSNVTGTPPGNSVTIYFEDSDGAGPYTISWPASVVWNGGTAVTEIGANSNVEVSLISPDGGTTWRARKSGEAFA